MERDDQIRGVSLYPRELPIEQQIEHIVAFTHDHGLFSIPVAIDVEISSEDTTPHFLDTLEAGLDTLRATRHTALYCNGLSYKVMKGLRPLFPWSTPVWLASYGHAPAETYGYNPPTILQTSGGKTIKGIEGAADFDVWMGSEDFYTRFFQNVAQN